METHLAKMSTPPLSRDEEIACFVAWRDRGDRRAAETIVRANLGLIMRLASRYVHRGVDYDDLVACGLEGFYEGMRKFDPERGVRVNTYAMHWANQRMRLEVARALAKFSGAAQRRGSLRWKISAEIDKVNRAEDPAAEMRRIATELKTSIAQLQEWMFAQNTMVLGFDAPASSANGVVGTAKTLGEFVQGNESSPDERLLAAEEAEALREALSILRPQEADVIDRIYFSGTSSETVADVGRSLGVSRQRAQQIEKSARDKMAAVLRKRIGRGGEKQRDDDE